MNLSERMPLFYPLLRSKLGAFSISLLELCRTRSKRSPLFGRFTSFVAVTALFTVASLMIWNVASANTTQDAVRVTQRVAAPLKCSRVGNAKATRKPSVARLHSKNSPEPRSSKPFIYHLLRPFKVVSNPRSHLRAPLNRDVSCT